MSLTVQVLIEMVLGFFTPVTSFLDSLVQQWVGIWETFNSFMGGFAELGLEGIAQAIEQYGPSNPDPSPTFMLLGGIYVVGSMIPGVLFMYYLLGRFVDDRRKAMVGALAYKSFMVWFWGFYLGARPTPFEIYNSVTVGPVLALGALKTMIVQNPPEAFMAFAAFVIFFSLSWAMFYGINLLMYSATLLIRADPVWNESSAKGHAFTFALVWIFFLTMAEPGTAFLNTMMIIFIIIFRRSDYKEKFKQKSDDKTKELASVLNRALDEREGAANVQSANAVSRTTEDLVEWVDRDDE